MLVKKVTTMMLAVGLTLAVSSGILAAEKDKTVYLEYETEKDVADYGPTLGIDWNANQKWTLSLSYQLEGDDDNEATGSIGAEYAIRENLAAKLSFDFADSEDSTCLELSGSYALKEPWALTGGITYTDYAEEVSATDYDELELSAGFEYQVSEALLTSMAYVTTDPSNDETTDKIVLGAEYTYGDYGFYCEYEIPDEGYTATLGVSYNF